MTEKSLARLRKKLPKKWATILAKRTGLSKVTIEKHLYGYRVGINYEILEAAIQLVQEEKKKHENFEQKIESL